MSRYAGRRFTVDSRGVGRRYAGRLAATLAVGVLGASPLAACSGAPGADAPTRPATSAASVVVLPTADATSLVSSSGSTTGFDVLANIPAAAKQHTNAGAQAFARYYIDAFSSLLMSPARGQLSRLFKAECQECLESEAIIVDNLEHARRYSGKFYATKTVGEPEVNGTAGDASNAQEIRLISLVTSTGATVSAPASATTKEGGRDVLIQWRLRWVDDQWFVTYFKGTNYTPPAR
jgi:hypothetical protein